MLVVVERQKRKRPFGIENLERDIVMGVFVVEPGDDRGMVILPARHTQQRGIARWRIAPLGTDQQRGMDGGAVGKFGGNAMRIAGDRHGMRFHAQIDLLRRLCRFVQCAAKDTVFVHGAERILALARIEIELARFQPVAHPDRANRTARIAQPVGHADRLQHAVRRAGDGGGAPVMFGGKDHLRIGGIDDDRGDAMRIERSAQRAADKAAAKDENISPFHDTGS